jgi:acetyl esterase/lipase
LLINMPLLATTSHGLLRGLRTSASLAVAVLLSACVSHQGRPQPFKPSTLTKAQFSVMRDLTYTPSAWPQALTADLYQPQGDGPFPAVLLIHGGGWNGRSRADMDGIAAKIARRGYVVLNASYRFAPRWNFPAQLQDLQQAVLFMRTHAAEYHLQPDRIAAWGYSAGAQLAALLGVTGPTDRLFMEGARVQAVIAGGTPADLSYYPDGELTNGLMGVPYAGYETRWAEASPLRLVSSDDPPTFLYHGSFDFTVGSKNAYNMFAALNQANVPAELCIVRGIEHISMFFHSPDDRAVDFLNRRLVDH